MNPDEIKALLASPIPITSTNSPLLITNLNHSLGTFADSRLTTISAKLPDDVTKKTNKQHVIFLIDISGSMHGSNLNTAKSVFNTIFAAMSDDAFVSVVLFDDKQKIFEFDIAGEKTNCFTKSQAIAAGISQNIDAIITGGTTNIVGALAATAKVAKKNIRDTNIIFITDGIDNCFNKASRSIANDLLGAISANMRGAYPTEELPRVVPIGIGIEYDEQLLLAIGSAIEFHKTGFIHIRDYSKVACNSDYLIETVDPIRLFAGFVLTTVDGDHKYLPWGYLQHKIEKSFTFDSSKFHNLNIIVTLSDGSKCCYQAIAAMPTLTELNFDIPLLKSYLCMEHARINTIYQSGVEQKELSSLQAEIKSLLTSYPKNFIAGDTQCEKVVEQLSTLYTQIDDQIHARGQVLNLYSNNILAQSAYIPTRDDLLTQSSELARATSSAMTPGSYF